MSPASDQIHPGDEVHGSDGDFVGRVVEVHPAYLVVESDFFPTDYAVPVAAITEAGNGQVMLNVAKDAILQSGWDTVPKSALGGLQVTDTFSTDAIETMDVLGTADVVSATMTRVQGQPQVTGYEATHEDEIVIPLHEEDLIATVRAAPAFVARIQKRVVTEERVLEEPVTEQQIRVERRIVDRVTGENDAGAFEEIVITIPLTAQEVESRKRAQVTEELIVTKEVIHRTKQVRGTVRREEVDVVEDATVIRDVDSGTTPRR
ncbi:MAG TPA: YsnF/AvaK domain-containing protein [Roseomonas sp.]|jgi:uncharacterized protein (TIGR02271 family)